MANSTQFWLAKAEVRPRSKGKWHGNNELYPRNEQEWHDVTPTLSWQVRNVLCHPKSTLALDQNVQTRLKSAMPNGLPNMNFAQNGMKLSKST
ncbi:hypothetical protein SUGI_0616640 [Cryptomeria japonica]|nr:hypothetical protein SUGI_0616640 [Cryptomeria japonica]